MASVTETVNYIYSADTGDLVSDVNKGSKANDGFTRSMDMASKSSHMLKGASSAVGATISGLAGIVAGATAGMLALGKATTTAKAEQDKINAVFDDSAIAISEYSATVSASLGVVQKDFEKVAAANAIQAQNMGMSEASAESYGVAVAQLTAVVSSYLGLPMAEAAERVTSAMRGKIKLALLLSN